MIVQGNQLVQLNYLVYVDVDVEINIFFFALLINEYLILVFCFYSFLVFCSLNLLIIDCRLVA
jgi:hypothetical protein